MPTADSLWFAAARQRASWLEAEGDRLTIDADVHLSDPAALPPALRRRTEESPDYFHGKPISAEALVDEMDAAGVDAALAWINPAAVAYGEDPAENGERLWQANRYVAEAALRHPCRILPAGWTDPRALGLAGALALVDRLTGELALPVVKLNPAQNRFPLDGPEAVAVVERIAARGAAPAFHFGADTPFTPPAALASLAGRFPEVPLLAVHMGGGGASYLEAEEYYREARALGLRHPNLFYILSARRDTHGESDLIAYQAAGAPFRERLACASDCPYGRIAWNFGGYRALFAALGQPARHPDPRVRDGRAAFDSASVRGYLGGNLARLYAGQTRRLLGRA